MQLVLAHDLLHFTAQTRSALKEKGDMRQLLVIVSGDRPDLYEYLTRSYSRREGVRVILDRREKDPQPVDRYALGLRGADRRRRPTVDAQVAFRTEVG